MTAELAARVSELLRRHAAVADVRLVGSRRRGDTTALSDLDLEVDVNAGHFAELVHDLPALVEELQPLGAQWDRLSDRWNYMLLMPGPVKVDLIFDEPYEKQPPWEVTAETLPDIEHHFWDWTLWLGSKHLRGEHELVASELTKMHGHLLGPLGVPEAPRDLWEAIDGFEQARDRAEARLGVKIDRTMADEVIRALRAAL